MFPSSFVSFACNTIYNQIYGSSISGKKGAIGAGVEKEQRAAIGALVKLSADNPPKVLTCVGKIYAPFG